MNMEVNWAEHYKAVNARLGKAQKAAPVILRAASPPREKASPVERYPFPIGPVKRYEPPYIGYVVYQNAGDNNFFRRLRANAQRQRPKHALDKVIYLRPIGPHGREKPAPRPNDKRDWLVLTTVKPRMIAAKEIIRQVCAEYNVIELDVISHRRSVEFTRPRQKICYRLRHETALSMPGIGRLIKRDHTSVLHSIRKATALIKAGEMAVPAPAAACVEG